MIVRMIAEYQKYQGIELNSSIQEHIKNIVKGDNYSYIRH